MFAIDEVITDVPVAGWVERTLGLAIHYAFVEYRYLTAIAALVVVGLIGWLIVTFVRNRREGGDDTSGTGSQHGAASGVLFQDMFIACPATCLSLRG